MRERVLAMPAWTLGVAGFAIFLALWEALPGLSGVDASYLPPASVVLRTLAGEVSSVEFWAAVASTMKGWAIGLLVASTVGTVLGMLIGSVRVLRTYTHSTIEFLRPIPSVALIPLAVLLFGVEIQSKLLLVIYASFWQVLIQVLYGVADVDPVAESTARTYGLGRLARLRHVTFPTVLPYLMTGLRLGSSVALILAVTAELVIGNPGLGREISLAKSGGATASMYALVLCTGLLGLLVNVVFRKLEVHFLAWHSSVRGEVHA